VGAAYWLISFFKKPLFPCKRHTSLCAFAIYEDGADKLSSAPFSKMLDPPLCLPNSVILAPSLNSLKTRLDKF